MTQDFDHIVIGGGSSGCVAAARLASIGNARVLLLEAGHSHHHPLLDMPPGIFKMIQGTRFMKYHKTLPQPQLGGRVIEIPQAHVLGGGSSVNAQVYMRGRPADYNHWDDLLCGNNDRVGWRWEDVLPHFRAMESNNRLNNDLHGTTGEMQVSDPGHITDFSRWFVQAVQALDEPFNPDFNGVSQRGVGFYQFMNRHGKRSSAAYAFIAPQENNPNLSVRLHCAVQRIIIENGRAIGVEYKNKRGVTTRVQASGDIILSAGALISPKLLMLSGIGPADHLKEFGIACVSDLPGVGMNLIDHPEVPIVAVANGPYGYFKQGNGWRMLRNGIEFKLFGSGPITSAGVEAGAFVNPRSPSEPPTIQAFCVPTMYIARDAPIKLKEDYGMTITTVLVKPKSRGTVRLVSADPAIMPGVCPNMLGDPADMQEMIEGQRFFMRAFDQSPLSDRIKSVAMPSRDDLSDEALRTHCKQFLKTNYHPSGTAKMGADSDKMAVLDGRMRVRGVENLRVCDMSAVPDITAGNTNAPAMMLGDRCADMIMGKI